MARNGDGLFKHGVNWHFRYLDPQGQLRERSTAKEKLRDAKGVRDQFLDQLRKGQLPTDLAKWPLERALAEFLENRKEVVSPTTLPPERTAVRHLCQLIGGAKRLEQITPLDLARYQATRRRSVGPKSVNNELLVLTAVLKQARLWHALEEAYRPLRVPKGGPGLALTAPDAERLIGISSMRPSWTVALCASLLAQQAGCRAGEIKKLRIADVHIDSSRPFLCIRRENTKSDAGAREAALNEVAVWAVRRLLARARLLGATSSEHYLLPANLSRHTKRSDPLYDRSGFDPTRHQETWASSWETLRTAAGLPMLRFHDLRHTHITWAIQAGAPIEVVMAQVGHISPEMTRYYTHLGSGVKHDLVCRVQQTAPGLLTGLVEVSAAERNHLSDQLRSRESAKKK